MAGEVPHYSVFHLSNSTCTDLGSYRNFFACVSFYLWQSTIQFYVLPGFLIMSRVCRIVNIMSLVVPATVCLLILGYLGAIIIAQWTQCSPDCKV
jgi:hypothetical protein